jgi:Tfp pilus assembly protein PilF
MDQAHVPAEQVRAMLDAASNSDPMRGEYARDAAMHELRQRSPDADRIIGNFERAVRLDPNSVRTHREFADALAVLGRTERAIDEYREALRCNEMLAPEEPKRLSPREITLIEQRIRTLNSGG